MGYKNRFSAGYEVERCLSGGCGVEYNVHAHGDIGAFYNSISNAHLPAYTAMFYRPSEHETFSEIKYSKVELGYDPGLRGIHDSLRGPPVEAYIPAIAMVPDAPSNGGALLIRNAEVLPKQSVVDEILRAQAEVLAKKPNEGSEDVIVRTTEVQQDIHIHRSFKRVEVFRKKEDK